MLMFRGLERRMAEAVHSVTERWLALEVAPVTAAQVASLLSYLAEVKQAVRTQLIHTWQRSSKWCVRNLLILGRGQASGAYATYSSAKLPMSYLKGCLLIYLIEVSR
jgi:hypothetical protein